jgi:anti-anti-sigma factor
MDVTRSQHGAVAILAVQGPLTIDQIDVLDAEIDACVESRMVKIVIDLAQAPFIDSAGLERLHTLASDLGKRGGDVRVSSLNEVCRDIFHATRLESVVQLFADNDSAVSSLS